MALDKAKLDFVLGNMNALPVEVKANLEKEFLIRYLLFSTTIENKVSLSLDQANAFLEKGEVHFGDLEESAKVKLTNQKKAYDFMLQEVSNGTFFNEELIKKFHEIIMDSEYGAGEFRVVNISVNGSMYVPPRAEKIDGRMVKMFEEAEKKEDIIEKIAYIHGSLDKIHPFLDGNGRCARLVLNYLLIKNKLLPITFTSDNKKEYFKALEDYKVQKDINPLIDLINKLENEELARYENEIKKYI